MQFELTPVTVEILNDGTYDGLKHLEFPIRVENCLDYGVDIGLVEVPISELIEAGYDIEEGGIAEQPDGNYGYLAFSYSECRIIEKH